MQRKRNKFIEFKEKNMIYNFLLVCVYINVVFIIFEVFKCLKKFSHVYTLAHSIII